MADWIDSRTGKELTTEKLVHKQAEEILQKYFKNFKSPEPKTLSLLESVFKVIITVALKKAKEHKIRDSEAQAAFIVGFLSSRLSLNDFEIKIKKKKV
jgi:hypothetical protein